MSFLAWIDFDQADRDRTRRILDLFGEEDTRDELGLGSVRDALSDLMFPGTSTIQTRLRYMFFVPWIYQLATGHKGSATSRAEFARALEIRLIHSLVRGAETTGVIGSEAREHLKRLPSDVYWAGLGVLGIRRFHGARSSYMELQNRSPDDGSNLHLWAPGLPLRPSDDWLDSTTFQLTRDEGGFFRDRLTGSAQGSLFTELAQSGEVARCESIWTHPQCGDLSPANRLLVRHAKYFSTVMHGASLLYNLMLSERSAQAHEAVESVWFDRVDSYRNRLAAWRETVDRLAIDSWRLDEVWPLCATTGHKVTPLTIRFVSEWLDAVRETRGDITENPRTRNLVEVREIRLKGGKSRFRNAAALSRWNGASGTQPLFYRWPIVSSHLKDLADAT